MIVKLATPRLELWRISGNYSNTPHVHGEDYQVTVPIGGTCRFTMENKPYELTGGCGIVQHPNDRHSFEIDESSGVIIFKVRQDGWSDLARGERVEFSVLQRFDPILLSDKFRRWSNALMDGDPLDPLAQGETESQVVRYLFGAVTGNFGAGADAEPLRTSRERDPHVGRALEYLHAHYKEEIRIETLSQVALMSRHHFIRSFKAAIGVSPYQYVQRLRIEEAKRLLRQSDASVTEIGLALGFSSISPFYRAFRKTVGIAPESYRNETASGMR
ncbi:AraC family transcriptional regulator [Cohnella caldifontis]|uniref:AraC family transcriptional regulator n=1 Tax=Cohnella caldifontis TaxID=3027471 RepID=UPI0023EDAA33|nr:AraC family transcriptional regulator [Cohnella sp. YIM B05605]